MASLPYLASPGSLNTAFERIRAAATPARVTGDFVTTKLQIKGGTGLALPPFLKKIGFVAADGAPTELYGRFRNSATMGAAAAEAIKIGYKDLQQVNEYFYELPDKQLLDLIVQVTGVAADNSVAKLTHSTLKILKSFADFEASAQIEPKVKGESSPSLPGLSDATSTKDRVGLNLAYTINLNLPATSDQAVFNAIFKSLREHLLTDDK